jgi:hypothetical protein
VSGRDDEAMVVFATHQPRLARRWLDLRDAAAGSDYWLLTTDYWRTALFDRRLSATAGEVPAAGAQAWIDVSPHSVKLAHTSLSP